MSTPKEFGNIFRSAREQKGLSVEEAVRKTKIHEKVIKDIESGVFDRLGRVYVKSFLRKYSSFLGLDQEQVMKRFAELSPGIPEKDFTFAAEGTEEEQVPDTDLPELKISPKNIQMVLAGILGFVLLVLVIIFGSMLRSRVDKVKSGESINSSVPVKNEDNKGYVTEAAKNVSADREKGGTELSLKARGDSWIQVKVGDKTLFAGILKKGQKKTWRSPGEIVVWTGKAENLYFDVNNNYIGEIAAGVVKNIRVSPEGIRVGKNWVTRFD